MILEKYTLVVIKTTAIILLLFIKPWVPYICHLSVVFLTVTNILWLNGSS